MSGWRLAGHEAPTQPTARPDRWQSRLRTGPERVCRYCGRMMESEKDDGHCSMSTLLASYGEVLSEGRKEEAVIQESSANTQLDDLQFQQAAGSMSHPSCHLAAHTSPACRLDPFMLRRGRGGSISPYVGTAPVMRRTTVQAFRAARRSYSYITPLGP